MSASTPNTGDLEALRRAQRAHEPSMEEILASIRNIIAEDREPAAPPRAAAALLGPQIVYSSDAPTPLRALEASPRAELQPPAEPMTPKVVWSQPAREAATRDEPAPNLAPTPEAMGGEAGDDETAAAVLEAVDAAAATPADAAEAAEPLSAEEAPLLSSEAGRAVSSSFTALSASLALQSAELAESLAREMLRPMLKTWLDENLPALVERLVRAEIQRVARGGR